MSRCFPFPPPGYEKEARTYDLDLFKKEKDKERKLKKEKKNREKKEGKEKGKKDRDRSDSKRRDKKDKKDKHRDKKDKDRENGKDRSTLDDKPLPKLVEHFSVDKASDEKKLPRKYELNTVDIFIQNGRERESDRNSLSGGKNSLQFSVHSEKVSQNSIFTEPRKDPKFLQQADRGIRDEIRGAGKKSVEKFTGADARKDEGTVRLATKSTSTSSDVKEKIKKSEDRKSDDQGIKDGPRFIGTVTSQSISGIVQPRLDKTLKPLEKDGEGKDKSKKKESDDRQGDKRKDKESREKEKDRDKEKIKEEIAKSKSQHKKSEPDKLNGKDHIFTGIYNAKTSQFPEESIKNPVIGGNPKKRKDLDTNGFLSADDIRPSKVLKPTSSHLPTQNGKILETTCPVLSGRQAAVNKLQPDGKEHRKNGIVESPASTTSSTILAPLVPAKPLITAVKADPVTEPPRKLPHPDSKYLSEVLTVPKMEDWSEFDDQDWLFHGSDSQPKKPKVGGLGLDEIPQVWSEALRIESADICALPYVIPY